MIANYKPLKDFIREVRIRNTDLKAKELLGINVNKFFMPSVANVIGTDLTNYKVIQKNQFACNRMHVGRDYRIPVSLSKIDEPFMVSPAYDVFETKDINVLIPEYLMMWFSRDEFDRNAWFYTDADVRGGLNWKAFCEMQLPIPSPNKQKEIVAEYNTVQNRINLNKKLIQKLEETAQAIYKQWFVDFEFPDENGKPYKSSGGEMMESDFGQIPKGYRFGRIGDLVDIINGYAFTGDDFNSHGNYPIIKITNIVSPGIDLQSAKFYSNEIDSRLNKCVVKKNDILISMTGSHINQMSSAVGKVGRYNYEYSALLNQRVSKLESKGKSREFIFQTMLREDIRKEILTAATGSANQANISPDTIKDVKLLIPNKSTLSLFEEVAFKLYECKSNYVLQNQKLAELKDLLLSKLATIKG